MNRRWRLPAAVGLCALVAFASRETALAAIGRTLVCAERAPSGDVILLDNFDYDYGLFRRGAELQRAGLASRVLVPATTSDEKDAAAAAREVANAFARLAGLARWDFIPVEQMEPISLNTAYKVRDFILGEHISSVTLLSPGFRSRRSELIYRSVLGENGITMACLPVFGATTPETWAGTWHGVQDVALQFMKLQYYRFWVMPFLRQ